MRLCQFLFLLVSLLPFAGAQMTDWFVDATNPGPGTGTKIDPFRALTSAVSAANDDDRIFVSPGTYDQTNTAETYPLVFGAVSQLRIQIIATDGPNVTILDGLGLASSNGLVRFRTGAAGARFQGFTLQGYAGTNGVIRLGSITAGFEATDVEISGCIIKDAINGSGIATFGASNQLKIHDNIVYNCFDNGIWGSDITCNLVNGLPGGGEIINNTVVNCGNGIRVQGGTWSVQNNIVMLCFNGGIVDFGFAGSTCANPPLSYTMNFNCVYLNATDYLNIAPATGAIPGPNDLNVDPLFVNLSGNDFHLQASSPCRDAGTAALPPSVDADIDGGPRLLIGPSLTLRPEMGADEITDVRLTQIAPASLAAGFTGFNTTGPPGDFEAKAFALLPGNTIVGGLGNLLLDLNTLFIIDLVPNVLDGSGNSVLGIPLAGIPPSAIGTPVWFQAAVVGPSGGRLTNSVLAIIAP